MVRHACLGGFSDQTRLASRHPIEDFLKAHDVILVKVEISKSLEPALFMVCTIAIDDGSLEDVQGQEPDLTGGTARDT